MSTISCVNSCCQEDATTSDSTLNSNSVDQGTGGTGGVGVTCVLNSLIKSAPGLLVLGRTSNQNLPVIAGGTANNPTLKAAPSTSLLANTNVMITVIIAMLIVGMVIYLIKR